MGSRRDKKYICYVYNECNVLVGYCIYNKIDENVYIEFINIFDEYRRRGYATEVVKELKLKYILTWDHKFTDDGKLWYESLVKKSLIG